MAYEPTQAVCQFCYRIISVIKITPVDRSNHYRLDNHPIAKSFATATEKYTIDVDFSHCRGSGSPVSWQPKAASLIRQDQL